MKRVYYSIERIAQAVYEATDCFTFWKDSSYKEKSSTNLTKQLITNPEFTSSLEVSIFDIALFSSYIFWLDEKNKTDLMKSLFITFVRKGSLKMKFRESEIDSLVTYGLFTFFYNLRHQKSLPYSVPDNGPAFLEEKEGYKEIENAYVELSHYYSNKKRGTTFFYKAILPEGGWIMWKSRKVIPPGFYNLSGFLDGIVWKKEGGFSFMKNVKIIPQGV